MYVFYGCLRGCQAESARWLPLQLLQLLDDALYAGIPPEDAHLLLMGTSKSGDNSALVAPISLQSDLAQTPAPLTAPSDPGKRQIRLFCLTLLTDKVWTKQLPCWPCCPCDDMQRKQLAACAVL